MHGSPERVNGATVLGPTARSAIPERSNGGHDEGAEQRRWVGGCRAGGPRQAGRCPHGGGLVGQGRASGPGFLQRFADATAGSRLSRPRGSQCAHAGARGSKMRVILRRINEPIFAAIGARGAAPRRLQCVIDDDCTLTLTFPRFFIQKLCRWADRASEGSLASKPSWGIKCACFRACARVCRGGSLGHF